MNAAEKHATTKGHRHLGCKFQWYEFTEWVRKENCARPFKTESTDERVDKTKCTTRWCGGYNK